MTNRWTHSLGQLDRDRPLRVYLYRLAPELELRVYAAVEDEILAVGVEGRDGRMMRHLLADYPADLPGDRERERGQIYMCLVVIRRARGAVMG